MKKTIFLLITIILSSNFLLYSAQGNDFVFTQLKYKGNWDPYPTFFSEIYQFMTLTTSIKFIPQRRIIEIEDESLYSSPFLYLTGRNEFEYFSEKEIQILREYLKGGGLLVIDNALGEKGIGFDRAIRREIERIFPQIPLEKISSEHAIFYSFYLKPRVTGRKMISPFLEGIEIDGRLAIVYSMNDFSGAWIKDNLGNYLYQCLPGGETQRWEAMKLTANIIVYSVTGTYKKDAIHQPFIQQKIQ